MVACTTTRGHTRKGKHSSFCMYSVYRNKTDTPIIIDGTAKECAAAMGVTLQSFYRTVSRQKKGRSQRVTVIWRFTDESEDVEDG